MSKLQNLGWNSNKDSATLTNRFWTQNKLPRCHFIQPSSGVHTEGCKVRSVNATQAPLCCDRISLSTWAKEPCKWSWRNWAEVAKFQTNQFHPISWVPMGPPIHQLLMTPPACASSAWSISGRCCCSCNRSDMTGCRHYIRTCSARENEDSSWFIL